MGSLLDNGVDDFWMKVLEDLVGSFKKPRSNREIIKKKCKFQTMKETLKFRKLKFIGNLNR